MNQEIAVKWVDALRSGKYGQAREMLKWSDGSSEGFCCLGVLCDLYSQENPLSCWTNDDRFLGEHSHLPKEVREWAGMRTDNGSLWGDIDVEVGTEEEPAHVTANNLADMNDEGCEFRHIAEVISSHVEDL